MTGVSRNDALKRAYRETAGATPPFAAIINRRSQNAPAFSLSSSIAKVVRRFFRNPYAPGGAALAIFALLIAVAIFTSTTRFPAHDDQGLSETDVAEILSTGRWMAHSDALLERSFDSSRPLPSDLLLASFELQFIQPVIIDEAAFARSDELLYSVHTLEFTPERKR